MILFCGIFSEEKIEEHLYLQALLYVLVIKNIYCRTSGTENLSDILYLYWQFQCCWQAFFKSLIMVYAAQTSLLFDKWRKIPCKDCHIYYTKGARPGKELSVLRTSLFLAGLLVCQDPERRLGS